MNSSTRFLTVSLLIPLFDPRPLPSTYKRYIDACGNVGVLLGVVGGLTMYNIVSTGSSYWLGYWADHTDDDCCKDNRGLLIYTVGKVKEKKDYC